MSCVESLCSSVRANSTLRVLDLSGVALRKPEDLNRVADALRENRSVRLFSTGGFKCVPTPLGRWACPTPCPMLSIFMFFTLGPRPSHGPSSSVSHLSVSRLSARNGVSFSPQRPRARRLRAAAPRQHNAPRPRLLLWIPVRARSRRAAEAYPALLNVIALSCCIEGFTAGSHLTRFFFLSTRLLFSTAAALGAELAGCGAALPALRHVALKDYLQPRYGRMSTPSVLALLGTAVPANERLTVHFLEDLTLPWFILDLSGGGVAAEEAAQEVALWDLDPNGGDPAAADAFAPLAQGLAALPLRLFERVRFKCTELRWEAGKALRDLAWPTEEEEREDGGAGAAAAAAGGATAAAGAGAGAAGSDREGGAGGAGVAVAAN